MLNSNIDIDILVFSYLYYRNKGYKSLSAPMLVDKDVLELTLPEGREPKEHLDKYYVGSAEQSFYQLIKNGLEPEGSYMMVTPCHRDEIPDDTHFSIFLKMELVSVDKTYINIAKDVFDFYTKIGEDVELLVTGGSTCDIMINNVEVGSFGTRIYKGIVVNYGTGLALPRFSQATVKQ